MIADTIRLFGSTYSSYFNRIYFKCPAIATRKWMSYTDFF